jgi:hypothetical protein
MLLRDIAQIKEFIPVNNSLDFVKVQPFVQDAERIVEDVIGSALYNELDTYVNSHLETEPPTVNAYFDSVINKLCNSISFLAFHLGYDVLNTVFSNTGFHRVETEDGSKKALFQRQEESLKRTFKLQGYNKLDLALEYLEKNKAEFDTWTASDAYTLMKSNFINSTKEFSSIYNINNSRLVFLKLRNAQVVAEDFDIKTMIGADYFEELKAQILADNLSDANEVFVIYLKKAVAYRTIFRGGLSLIAELNELGLYKNEIASSTDNIIKETAVSEQLATRILEDAEQKGMAYLRSCESFLKKNIADYPLYAASDAYDETGTVYNLSSTTKIGVI